MNGCIQDVGTENIVEDKDSKYNYAYNKELTNASMSPETKKTVKAIREKLKKLLSQPISFMNLL